MIRMAEAHARMHLREYVHEEGGWLQPCEGLCEVLSTSWYFCADLNVAIQCMLESFISTQKAATVQRLRTKLSRFLTYKKVWVSVGVPEDPGGIICLCVDANAHVCAALSLSALAHNLSLLMRISFLFAV